MAKERYSALEVETAVKSWSGSKAPMKPLQALKYLPTGEEIMDPTPMEPPIGYHRTPSLAMQMREMIRIAKLQDLENSMDPETIEEADDFEIPDDDIVVPQSPWENDRDPSIAELVKAGKGALEDRARKAKEAVEEQQAIAAKKAARAASKSSSIPAGGEADEDNA